jgi:hypothetical protein
MGETGLKAGPNRALSYRFIYYCMLERYNN